MDEEGRISVLIFEAKVSATQQLRSCEESLRRKGRQCYCKDQVEEECTFGIVFGLREKFWEALRRNMIVDSRTHMHALHSNITPARAIKLRWREGPVSLVNEKSRRTICPVNRRSTTIHLAAVHFTSPSPNLKYLDLLPRADHHHHKAQSILRHRRISECYGIA